MGYFGKILITALIFSAAAFAQIIESRRMADILSLVNTATLVIFDLDNTILEAGQTVGSDQWFEHRIGQLKSAGLAADEAVAQTVVEWQAVNFAGRVRLVESSTPELIRSLQEQGIPTMGLTARPATFMNQSLRQLKKLGVDFTRQTLTDKTLSIQGKEKAAFKQGLMSVGGNNKGSILVALLKEVGFVPERVVFVDDKIKNVTHVDVALEAEHIPSFAFRYGAADAKVKAFDAALADFQLEYFFNHGKVLTDSQARSKM